jgi:beta-galactosidase/beta-glucuronidase
VDDPGVHPRPQLTRTRWTDLSGPWQFTYDDADAGLRERWFEPGSDAFDRTIVVPFPPESAASGIGDTGFHPVLWYRREFDQAPDADGALLLHVGAVDHRARVWVNGRLVSTHEGGHTPFTVDVTQALVDGGPQVLVVRAEDDPHDLEQPRGKQDWEELPHAIWYERTSGIWQQVWLEPVPATRVERLRWTPDLDAAVLRLDVRLTRADERPLRLRVVLTQHGEMIADDTVAVRGDRVLRDFPFAETDTTLGRHTLLWSPENPNLIDATRSAATRRCAASRPRPGACCSTAGRTSCGSCSTRATGASRTWRPRRGRRCAGRSRSSRSSASTASACTRR